jgi:tetratricopeptide (TPR) repeat protein
VQFGHGVTFQYNEFNMKDYYYILGIGANASLEELKRAYRKLSVKFHPDKNDGDKFFEDRFKEILEAYETLSDPDKKNRYDFKYNSNNKGGHDFGAFEQSFKQRYEEELRKQEREFKRKSEEYERKIKEINLQEDYLKKTVNKLEKEDFQKSLKKILKFLIIGLSIIALPVAYFYYENMKKLEKSAELLKLGKEMYDNDSLKLAIQYFNESIEFNPQSSDTYFARGVLFYAIGEKERAKADYDKAIALNSVHEDAYHNRGAIKDEMGDTKGAILDLSKAIQINPLNAIHYFDRGVCYRNFQDYAKAKEDFIKALEIRPNEATFLNSLANIYSDVGDYDQAISNYLKTLNSIDSSEMPTVYYNLGSCYQLLGEHKEAIQSYTDGVIMDPRNQLLLWSLGTAYDEIGEYEKAEQFLFKSLSVDSTHLPTRHSLCIVFRNQGKFDKALEQINYAALMEPRDMTYRVEKTRVLEDLEYYDQLFIEYLDLYKLFPGNFEIVSGLAEEYYFKEDYQKAIPLLIQSIELNSSEYLIHYYLGRAHLFTGNYEAAVTSFKKSIELNPTHANAYWDLAVLYKDQNDFENAVKYFSGALDNGKVEAIEVLEKMGLK